MTSAREKQNVVFLQGERLYLRPLDEDDIGRCVRWINDPEIRPFVLWRFPTTETAQSNWIRTQNEGNPPKGVNLAIVLHGGNRHIGNIGLNNIDWLHRHATTGMVIGEKDCWSRGYGHEAKELLLGYAFDALNFHRVSSRTFATNGRSIACLKKSGYVEEGVRREAYYRDGAWVDEAVFGLLAGEWRALRDARAAP